MSLTRLLAWAAAPLILGAAACARQPAPAPDVLATVDGVAIHEADVEYRQRAGGHAGALAPASRQNLLEAIVGEQLAAGRAVELGLDADPAYREAVRQLEAQAAAVKRRRLAELFWRRERAGGAEVSEAAARRYFDAHRERWRTELHVLQVLRRSEAEIRLAEGALARGAPFDALARSGGGAWDLGYVQWREVPAAWREGLEGLQPGEVSGVLRGGRDRFWILKLVDRREGPEVSFDAVRSAVVEQLRGAQAEQRREDVEAELRRRARLVYRPEG